MYMKTTTAPLAIALLASCASPRATTLTTKWAKAYLATVQTSPRRASLCPETHSLLEDHPNDGAFVIIRALDELRGEDNVHKPLTIPMGLYHRRDSVPTVTTERILRRACDDPSISATSAAFLVLLQDPDSNVMRFLKRMRGHANPDVQRTVKRAIIRITGDETDRNVEQSHPVERV